MEYGPLKFFLQNKVVNRLQYIFVGQLLSGYAARQGANYFEIELDLRCCMLIDKQQLSLC